MIFFTSYLVLRTKQGVITVLTALTTALYKEQNLGRVF